MADIYIWFSDFRVDDGLWAHTLEDAMTACTAYAGIHDHDYKDMVNEAFGTDLSNWIQDIGDLWSISGGQLTATKPSGDWNRIIHKSEVTFPFRATFDKVGATGGFVFGWDIDDEHSYLVYWTSTLLGFGSLSSAGVLTKVSEIPWDVTSACEMAVMGKVQRLTAFEVANWLSVAIYIDGRCLLTASCNIDQSAMPGMKIGFAVNGGTTCTVDNLNVPELARVLDYFSIDPTEHAGAGMNRAVGTSRLFYFCRFDGTFKAWRPQVYTIAGGSTWTPSRDRFVQLSQATNMLAPAHLRVVGAWRESEIWDDNDILYAGRHVFAQNDDPNLITDTAIVQESRWALHDTRNSAIKLSLAGPTNPFIEPQDLIYYDYDGSLTVWRVETIQYGVSKTGNAPHASMAIECKRHITPLMAF